MAKINYNHARRQKETARKSRQQEKLARRTSKDEPAADGSVASGQAPAADATNDAPDSAPVPDVTRGG